MTNAPKINVFQFNDMSLCFLIHWFFYYRFHVSLFGQTESEFVWMKNPGDMTPSGEGWTNWEQHVLINNGPDVYITMHTLTMNGASYSAIVAGESV